jgi:hypothetical protein
MVWRLPVSSFYYTGSSLSVRRGKLGFIGKTEFGQPRDQSYKTKENISDPNHPPLGISYGGRQRGLPLSGHTEIPRLQYEAVHLYPEGAKTAERNPLKWVL